MKSITRETTLLQKDDLFAVYKYVEAKFDYPLHIHHEYEINLVCHTKGTRIIGDSIESFDTIDLILVGPNLPHKWKAPTYNNTTVITVFFHDLLSNSFFNKSHFRQIKEMLLRSKHGLDFSEETKLKVVDMLFKLSETTGFNSSLLFLSILQELAECPSQRPLASISYDRSKIMHEHKSRRIAQICNYIENNYEKQISLAQVSDMIGMTETSLSHFFKKRTSRTFSKFLTEVRVSQALKLLINTTHTISEISYSCGFNNLSNFNRTFKSVKGLTPSDYRKTMVNE
ncbi:AraC family transcriptional regulator [Sphingobacterium sp. SRCM116780]|uniref:AraC family transcriptional regulator n=1 Tax=Sphingobacterium sp. SRCM116780 TaxID=2907623 RepID=UPI001F3AD318|nr:AraC family transcriptional regulator [Sphingobacterium sp. SRCM116780]UIR56970.1 AraC family transcriptional regulator [Sphingobacterium sp. SRCM116780]